MKINWFSPLPDLKTGIAGFTAGLLRYLGKAGELTLWTDQERWENLPSGLEGVRVRRFNSGQVPWRELNEADLTFYNIGNNARFHSAAYEVSRRHPGIVILHETRLHHFFFDIFRDRMKSREAYLRQMADCHGPEAIEAGMEIWEDPAKLVPMSFRYPLTAPVLENAIGTVVHTEEAFEAVRLLDRCPVARIELPDCKELTTRPIVPRRYDSRGPWRLILFGHLGQNRQVEAVLQALLHFPERHRFRLDLFGNLDHRAPVEALAQSRELRSLVFLHGHCSDAKLHSALESAHLAINLRNPPMGEASGSQLRIWHYALPSLVSRTGWYAKLPADTVAFVEPGNEIEDVQQHLAAFLENPEAFRQMGEAGKRRLAAVHSPEKYAAEIIGFGEQCRRARAGHPFAGKMAARVVARAKSWMSPDADARFLENISRQLARLGSNEKG